MSRAQDWQLAKSCGQLAWRSTVGARATDLTHLHDDEAAARELQLLSQSQRLLGGVEVLSVPMTNRLAVHLAIVERGVPYASLQCLITALPGLDEREVIKVLGISDRTLRRQRETPMKPMPVPLAGDVFGSQDKAEEWLNKPAMGLDGQRPIELLQTVQGTELVTDFLTRLDRECAWCTAASTRPPRCWTAWPM